MILLVDDDDGVRALTGQMLQDRGYSVIAARDGAEGLDKLVNEPRLSLILTDIRMPGIDGWELARRARAIRPDIKLMYITGYPEETPANAPAGPLLRKPWHMGEFHNFVGQLHGPPRVME